MAINFYTKELLEYENVELVNNSNPISRPLLDRAQILAHKNDFILNYLTEKQFIAYGVRFFRAWITGTRHVSTKSLNQLRPIQLKGMQVPMIHNDHFLLCRIIFGFNAPVGGYFLIEDVNGEVEIVHLNNCSQNLDYLKPNTIICIKEPKMEYENMKHQRSIRVDSPMDIIRVDETNKNLLKKANGSKWFRPVKKSFEELKKLGDQFLAIDNDFMEARKFYEWAKWLRPNVGSIYLDIADSLLGMDCFCEAYEMAKTALAKNGSREKALYRLGKAAYGMRLWRMAISHFETLSIEFPSSTSAASALQKSKHRLHESLSGDYNFFQLYHDVYTNKNFHVDVADFQGPVKISAIPGKGKGLVATENIPRGTLLLASKAYSAVFENDYESFLCFNKIQGGIVKSSHLRVVSGMVQKLEKNPQSAREIYDLYDGSEERSDNIPNGYIDVGKIERIVNYNIFKTDILLHQDRENFDDEDFVCRLANGAGLWVLSAYINHSCLENAYRLFYGDLMLVFAIADIQKDDEITLSYVGPMLNIKERQRLIQKFDFLCDCPLCALDQSDVLEDEREKIEEELNRIGSIQAIKDFPEKTLPQIENLVDRMRRTYEHRREFNYRLYAPLSNLSFNYRSLARLAENFSDAKIFWQKAADCLHEGVEALGDRMKVHVVPVAFLQLIECYEKMKNEEKVENLVRELHELYRIKTGVDKRVFEEIFHFKI